jgi:hypothetical protein
LKKKFFILFLVLLFLLISGYFLFNFGKNKLIKILSDSIGQPVYVDVFDFNPLKGIHAKNLRVGDLLKIETLEIDFTPLSLLNREILKFKADGVSLNVEGKGRGGGKGMTFPLLRIDEIEIDDVHINYRENRYSFLKLKGSILTKRGNGTITFDLEKLKGKAIDIERATGQISLRRKRVEEILLSISGKTLSTDIVANRVGEEWHFRGGNLSYKGILISRYEGSFKGKGNRGKLKVYDLVFRDIYLYEVVSDFSLEEKDRLVFERIKVRWGEGVLRGRAELINYRRREDVFYRADLWVKNFSLENLHIAPLILNGVLFLKGNKDSLSISWNLERIDYLLSSFRGITGRAKIKGKVFKLEDLWIEDPKVVANLKGFISENSLLLEGDVGITDFSFLPKQMGKIKGECSLTGVVKRDGGELFFNISGSAENIVYGDINAQNLFFSIKSLKEGLRVSAYKGFIRNLPFDSLHIFISLNMDRWGPYSLQATLPEGGQFVVEGIWRRDGDSILVKNERVLLDFGRIKETLESPIYIVASPGKLKFFTSQEKIFGGTLSLLRGEFSRRENYFEIDARMDELDLQVLHDLKILKKPTGGLLSFTIKGEGTLSDPSLSIEGVISGFSSGSFKDLEIYGAAEYRKDRIEVTEFTVDGYGKPVEGEFTIPLKVDFDGGFSLRNIGVIKGRIWSDGIRADILNDLIGYLLIVEKGEISFDLSFEGNPKDLSLYGEMKIKGDEGAFSPFNTHLTNILAEISFDEKVMHFEKIYAKSGEGEIRGSGSIRFSRAPDYVDLTFEVQRVKVEPDPYTEAVITGRVNVEGNIPRIWVDGDLHLDEAYLFVPFGRRGGGGGGPSPVRYRIHLLGEREIYLMNELAEMEFSADLEVKKEDDINTVYTGNLSVIGGTFMYLDRIFNVTEGEILFSGEKEFNPSLNIRGETQIDTITIYLYVTGTLNVPDIQLSSEPSLPTEDIISYLSFGKPLREVPLTLKDVELIRERALNLAEGFLSRELRRKLRISELELKTGLTGEDPRFTVGFYLSPSLYIRYTHDLLALEKDVFHLRYFLTRKTAIYAERDRDGEISTGIEFNFRF